MNLQQQSSSQCPALISPNPIDADWQDAADALCDAYSFELCPDLPTSQSPASNDVNTSSASSQHEDTSHKLPTFEAILQWPEDKQFPSQHSISHIISAQLFHQQVTQGSITHQQRLLELQRKSWKYYASDSLLAFCGPDCKKTLNVTPRCLMSLTCKHYLSNEDFMDLEALFTGLPIPSLQRNPAFRHVHGPHLALTALSHAGPVRHSTHQELVKLILNQASLAGLRHGTGNSANIPRSRPSQSDEHGDLYFKRGIDPGADRLEYVFDITLGHPFTGSGRHVPRKIHLMEAAKNRKYRSDYQEHHIQFVPLVCTTFCNIGPDFARFLYRLAQLQSHPDSLTFSHPSSSSSESLGGRYNSQEPYMDIPAGIKLSWILQDVLHQVALGTLRRMRGVDFRDVDDPASPVPSPSSPRATSSPSSHQGAGLGSPPFSSP
jgi:hypothetical protein